MMRGVFRLGSVFISSLPANSLISPKILFMRLSSVYSILQPGLSFRVPSLNYLIFLAHLVRPDTMKAFFFTRNSSDGVTSEIPMDRPQFEIHLAENFDNRSMQAEAISGVLSRIIE